jgi:hypothetical protein
LKVGAVQSLDGPSRAFAVHNVTQALFRFMAVAELKVQHREIPMPTAEGETAPSKPEIGHVAGTTIGLTPAQATVQQPESIATKPSKTAFLTLLATLKGLQRVYCHSVLRRRRRAALCR